MDMLSPSPVRVRVLGGFELIGAGGDSLTLPGRKLRALVALLALPPALGWSRERLTAVLWGDREEELARGSLRQALAELRRLLGDGCGRRGGILRAVRRQPMGGRGGALPR
jgi:DNA-binding SARP family transcriptional activator